MFKAQAEKHRAVSLDTDENTQITRGKALVIFLWRVDMRLRFLGILIGIILTSSNAGAEMHYDEQVDRCIQERSNSDLDRREMVCETYGNQTRCKSENTDGLAFSEAYSLGRDCAEEVRNRIAKKSTENSADEIRIAIQSSHNMPIGNKAVWNSGSAWGFVTPIRTGVHSNGKKCRQYKIITHAQGQILVNNTDYCDLGGGNWQQIN